MLVATSRGDVIAFVDATPEPGSVRLAAIYVLPSERGLGAGHSLLRAVRARFPGLPVVADVLVGNRTGERFYERRGFVRGDRFIVDLFGAKLEEHRWVLNVVGIAE